MNKSGNSVKIFYDGLSENFDSEQDEKRFEFVRKPESLIIEEFINNSDMKSKNVLEIGAGTGRFTIEIAKKCSRVLALDISEKMLNKLSEKANKNNSYNIETLAGGFLEAEIKDKFDYIVSFSAVEYIKDKNALFEKISSLLKEGGEVFITTAHSSFFRLFGRLGNYFRQKVYMNVYTKKEVKKLCEKYNMKIIKTEDCVMKTFFSKGILLTIHAKKNN